MAKDDYYTLVAKILVYLYKKYKQKERSGNALWSNKSNKET